MRSSADQTRTVFEDKALADQAVTAVEKQIHHTDETEAREVPIDDRPVEKVL